MVKYLRRGDDFICTSLLDQCFNLAPDGLRRSDYCGEAQRVLECGVPPPHVPQSAHGLHRRRQFRAGAREMIPRNICWSDVKRRAASSSVSAAMRFTPIMT